LVGGCGHRTQVWVKSRRTHPAGATSESRSTSWASSRSPWTCPPLRPPPWSARGKGPDGTPYLGQRRALISARQRARLLRVHPGPARSAAAGRGPAGTL